ncbi:hypothetical protein CK203_056382 [Vitis vinifera]|uniref:Reverse transcriptase Ty1/copia-type domain-containing protein n=1 Tax=Vitis vinifera TaxID=29760 RepID=A0A438GL34_VITVI|nr:hypothetical protein CK203_056382 [Vitis vinifera]
MYSEFEMSMMRELNFCLGLQIKKLKKGTFINQEKYIRDLLKRFNMEEFKTMKTPMSSFIKLDKDEKGKSTNSTMYRGMIGLLDWIFGRLEARVSDLDCLSFSRASQSVSVPVPLHFRTPRVSVDKRPTEPSQPKAHQKHFRFKGIFTRIGWLPVVIVSELVFPTLVRDFYLRVNYGMGCPIISTVRGVKIRLDLKSIYRIFDIASVGLRVAYDTYDDQSMRWMKFKKGLDGSRTEPELDIPPLQSMGVQFKISTLGTRIEELVVVSDTRFYSMEDRMDQYQANFTSQFEYL